MNSLHLVGDYISPGSKSSSPLDQVIYGSQYSFDLLAPHPDLFESELDSVDLHALSALDLSAYVPLDLHDGRGHPAFSGDYRSSQLYSGPASTFTTSSESASGYEYEASSYYSSRDSSSGYIPTADASSPYAQQMQTVLQPQSTYSDLDLDFSDFNLATGSPVAPLPTINTAALDSVHALMDAHTRPQLKTEPKEPAPLVPTRASDPIPRSANDDQASKKYACPSCPRSFARAFNLKTHVATHDPNRVKSFVCRTPGCGRSFSRKHDLGRHLTSIHGSTSPAVGMAGRARSGDSSPGSGSGSGKGGRVNKERVWCDGCGRGWIKGDRDGCLCGDSNPTKDHVS